jgi:Flp pilus assembly pilin Flp
MDVLARALFSLTRARRGGATIEQGLIAALIGVVAVSVVTTLGATMDPPANSAQETTSPN